MPQGTEVHVGDDWQVAVLSINPDATDAILTYNQFNDPPPDGHRYALARLQVRYVGDDSGDCYTNPESLSELVSSSLGSPLRATCA